MSTDTIIQDYEDFDAFARSLDNPRTWPEVRTSEKTNYRDDWFGTPNYPAAARLLRDGWTKGRAKLDKALATAAAVRPSANHRALGLDVAGAYPDVPAYCAGSPAHMVTVSDQERATRPIVRFRVSVSASDGIAPDDITRRAAAILGWIDHLEQTGARCEIEANFSSQMRGKIVGFRLLLKRADEPLEIDRAAFVLMHPSFLRRIIFRWCEHNAPRACETSSYGSVRDTPPENPNDRAITFGAMSTAETQPWSNPERAHAAVLAKIKAGGLEVDTDAEAA